MGLGYSAATPAAVRWFGPQRRGLIAAERRRRRRRAFAAAEPPHFLAIHPGEQRDAAVGLTSARDGEIALGDVDEERAQARLESSIGHAVLEKARDERTQGRRGGTEQALGDDVVAHRSTVAGATPPRQVR